MWWWILWLTVGYISASGLGLFTVLVSLARGADSMGVYEELMTAMPLGVAAGGAWLIGYPLVGPVWALLFVPVIFVLVVCLVLCAHMRVRVKGGR